MNESGDIVRAGPDDSVELRVQVVPRASRDAIGDVMGDRIKVHVKAPPVDGEANAAVVRTLAKALGVSRSSVELVRGATGKRKTLRVHGTDPASVRTALGLAGLLGLFAVAVGCGSDARDLPIDVILPETSTDLEVVDNASLTLDPGGLLLTQSIDGLDFQLQVELEPDDTQRTLGLFLAEDTTLRAWGNSAPFVTAGPDVGLALFVGRPGRLSTFPRVIDDPDPDLLATNARGRGMLFMDAQGHTFLLDHGTFEIEAGSTLNDPPSPDDGGLFSSPDGAVYRVTWADAPAAFRYDPSTDAWAELDVRGSALDARPGAAYVTEVQSADDGDGGELDATFVQVLGGGAHTDGVSLVLLPDALDVRVIDGVTLDGPRANAHATWVADGDDATADVVLFGGNEGDLPALRLALAGEAVGPTQAWSGGRCVQLRASSPPRMLCAGGVRDGDATSDALELRLGDPVEAIEHPDLLGQPLADPRWLSDDGAVYAQGNEALIRVDRADLATEAVAGAALRGSGGHSVTLSTGATFLTGGVTNGGAPLSRWQVFMPTIEQ